MIRRLILASWLLISGFGIYEYWTWPEVARLAQENPRVTAFIEQRLGGQRASARESQWVAYVDLPRHLKHAVLVAEDIDFFGHNGFAVKEMKIAVSETFREGKKLRGASTVTQQTVKNLWLSPSRNPWRKVKEAILTAQLERELSKHRILEIYLNIVEFGPGIFGAGEAAEAYYGRPPSQLSRRQAASLAAGLSRPSRWHPGSQDPRYRERVDLILRRIDQSSWLARIL